MDALTSELGIEKLSNSLFERLIVKCRNEGWADNFGSLHAQGRMHKKVVEFPSQQFYEGKLKPLNLIDRLHSDDVDDGSFLGYMHFHRTIFVDTPIDDQLAHKTNTHEADVVLKLLTLMYEKAQIDLSRVGVITPYRAQIALIDDMLSKSSLPTERITVDTVERYQGSARDYIVFSMCANGATKFSTSKNLSEIEIDKKFNVAITRAKECLMIIGNKNLLMQNALYRAWIEQAEHFDIALLQKYHE